jgi:hypothetical protein
MLDAISGYQPLQCEPLNKWSKSRTASIPQTGDPAEDSAKD